MIVRTRHPDDPERHIYVPVHYDRQRGLWLGIVTSGTVQAYESEREALSAALQHAIEAWGQVRRRSRVLRVLCEHDSFQFMRDGIDDDLVRDQSRDLAMHVHEFDNTLRHLLSQPDPDVQVDLDIDGLVVAPPAAE